MKSHLINTEHPLQDNESLVDVIQISQLLWTSNSIVLESKSAQEALQLVVDAVCLYNNWPHAYVHLLDLKSNQWYQSTIRCGGANEGQSSSFDPLNHSVAWTDVQVYPLTEDETSMRVLIPLSSEHHIVGYLEFISPKHKVSEYESSIYNQVGRQLGQRLVEEPLSIEDPEES